MLKYKDKALEYLNEYLKIFGIGAVVMLVWQVLEVVMLGEVVPSNIDSVIAIVLTFSLYLNLRFVNNGGKSNEQVSGS